MPPEEFSENQCHSPPPPPPDFCQSVDGDTCGPPPECLPFYGVAMPNFHTCSEPSDQTLEKSIAQKQACNSLCGEEGECPSAALVQPNASVIAPVQLGCLAGDESVGNNRQCTPPCAWLLCGGMQGPVGKACPSKCTASALFARFGNSTLPNAPLSDIKDFTLPVDPSCPAECLGDYTDRDFGSGSGGDSASGSGDDGYVDDENNRDGNGSGSGGTGEGGSGFGSG